MHDKLRLLTPGPTPVPEEVRLAMARNMLHHRKQDFTSIMQGIQKDLQQLFSTEQPVLPLSCSGSGAMQAAANNLFAPGEKVLVVEGGKFGQRWSEISRLRGLDVKSLEVNWGEAVNPEEIQRITSQTPGISGLLLQASETSTGVLHPIDEIGKISAKHNFLLVVDGISAVGISPCPMDKWGIDCLLTGSQKGLMLPPGLALLSLSQRAREKMHQVPRRDFYFDLEKELQKNPQGQTSYTSPIALIMGLQESLRIFMHNGLNNTYKKYWALTQMVREGIKAMGLELLVKEHFTWGLTSIAVPPGVEAKKVLDMMASTYNVYLAGGQDRLKGRILRMGHMGYVDFADILAGLHALQKSMSCFYPIHSQPDYLEKALQAYENAWQQDLPFT